MYKTILEEPSVCVASRSLIFTRLRRQLLGGKVLVRCQTAGQPIVDKLLRLAIRMDMDLCFKSQCLKLSSLQQLVHVTWRHLAVLN